MQKSRSYVNLTTTLSLRISEAAPVISAEYLKSIKVTHCPLYDYPLIYRSFPYNKKPNNQATLDRIIPGAEGGLYEPGNVEFMSWEGNMDKNRLVKWKAEALSRHLNRRVTAKHN